MASGIWKRRRNRVCENVTPGLGRTDEEATKVRGVARRGLRGESKGEGAGGWERERESEERRAESSQGAGACVGCSALGSPSAIRRSVAASRRPARSRFAARGAADGALRARRPHAAPHQAFPRDTTPSRRALGGCLLRAATAAAASRVRDRDNRPVQRREEARGGRGRVFMAQPTALQKGIWGGAWLGLPAGWAIRALNARLRRCALEKTARRGHGSADRDGFGREPPTRCANWLDASPCTVRSHALLPAAGDASNAARHLRDRSRGSRFSAGPSAAGIAANCRCPGSGATRSRPIAHIERLLARPGPLVLNPQSEQPAR